MNQVLAQLPWKEALTFGAVTAVLGGVVLTWPGPSILVSVTLFEVCLLGLA